MKSLLLFFLSHALGAAAFGSSIIVGAPGNANDGDCAPFGCALEYQQIYSAGDYAALGPITITALTFFNNNFVPGSIAPANYTISLSTTSAAVDGLDSTFAKNLGPNNAVFFSGALGGLIGPSNQFTITGTPFLYNPASGNLLLTLTSDGDGFQFSVFLDYLSIAPAGTFSRISSFDLSGFADTVQNDTGLVTQFTYSAQTSSVPEPSICWLEAAGLMVLAATLISRRNLGEFEPAREPFGSGHEPTTKPKRG